MSDEGLLRTLYNGRNFSFVGHYCKTHNFWSLRSTRGSLCECPHFARCECIRVHMCVSQRQLFQPGSLFSLLAHVQPPSGLSYCLHGVPGRGGRTTAQWWHPAARSRFVILGKPLPSSYTYTCIWHITALQTFAPKLLPTYICVGGVMASFSVCRPTDEACCHVKCLLMQLFA